MHIPYLQRSRTGIYYFRIVIPKALRATCGRRELRRSLRTRDLPQAILRMRRYLDEVPYALQEQRLMFDLDKLKKAAERGSFELEDVRAGNVTIGKAKADPTIPGDVEALQDTIQKLKEAAQASVPETPSPAPSASTPITPLNHQAVPQPTTVGKISDYVDEYMEHKILSKEWCEETVYEHKPKFTLLVEIIGDIPVTSVTKSKAKHVRAMLRQLPSNMKKRFPDCASVHEAIELVNALPADRRRLYSNATINKTLQTYNNFFTYLEDEKDLIETSPFQGITVSSKNSSDDTEDALYREPYSPEELTRLFTTRQYMEHCYNHPYQYWLMLIGLYSGARINEIAQLLVSDIDTVEKIDVFDINMKEPKRTKKWLKSKASKRMIPIHPKLKDLGFMDFVRDRDDGNPYTRLFPELPHKPGKGRFGAYASKWFNATLKLEAGFRTGEGDDFHTLRSTGASYLQNSHDIEEAKIAAFLGHSRKSITGKHYTGPFAVPVFKRFIDLFDFDQVLSHIKPYKDAHFRTEKERRSRKKQAN